MLSYKDRLLKCNLITLERRRLHADLILFYKIISGYADVNFAESLECIESSRTRGHNRRYSIPAARINCRANFFLNRTIPIWNALSCECVNAASIHMFRCRLHNAKLEKYSVFRMFSILFLYKVSI